MSEIRPVNNRCPGGKSRKKGGVIRGKWMQLKNAAKDAEFRSFGFGPLMDPRVKRLFPFKTDSLFPTT
jgi:hypothetical protein